MLYHFPNIANIRYGNTMSKKGLIRSASTKFPVRKKWAQRCIPQEGQSVPVTNFHRQGGAHELSAGAMM